MLEKIRPTPTLQFPPWSLLNNIWLKNSSHDFRTIRFAGQPLKSGHVLFYFSFLLVPINSFLSPYIMLGELTECRCYCHYQRWQSSLTVMDQACLFFCFVFFPCTHWQRVERLHSSHLLMDCSSFHFLFSWGCVCYLPFDFKQMWRISFNMYVSRRNGFRMLDRLSQRWNSIARWTFESTNMEAGPFLSFLDGISF